MEDFLDDDEKKFLNDDEQKKLNYLRNLDQLTYLESEKLTKIEQLIIEKKEEEEQEKEEKEEKENDLEIFKSIKNLTKNYCVKIFENYDERRLEKVKNYVKKFASDFLIFEKMEEYETQILSLPLDFETFFEIIKNLRQNNWDFLQNAQEEDFEHYSAQKGLKEKEAMRKK